MTPTQRKAMTLARDWIAEHPERRLCSAGTVVAILTRALAEQPAQLDPSVGTQVSKVWWDGNKLMAQPIPLEKLYKEPEQPAQHQEAVTVLPDGSAFAVMSYPLPKDHWLYADRQYNDGADEPVELGRPILTHEMRDAVVSAVRYAIRGATNCGKEVDFDPDALVQNAVYALCGPFTSPKPAQQQKEGFASPGGGYVPAIPRPMPLDWKLVPRKATPEMLKAMDECAQEGYDERLYAGMASSVYMAAWDASPVMGTLPEQPAEQEPVAVARPDPNCPTCHGTGVDGDCADDGSTIDVDCGCLKHLAPMPKPPWDGTYKDKCEDGKRCLQGCRSSERCYWVRKAPAPQPAKREPLPPASPCALTEAEYRIFKLGWLECEAAHGIGEQE